MEVLLINMTCTCNVGADNYLRPIDSGLWTTSMITDAKMPPLMLEEDFYVECHDIVNSRFGLDIGSQITADNCVGIYEHLVANI